MHFHVRPLMTEEPTGNDKNAIISRWIPFGNGLLENSPHMEGYKIGEARSLSRTKSILTDVHTDQ